MVNTVSMFYYRFRLINEQFAHIILLLDKAQNEFERVRFQDATFINDNAELMRNLRIILERHINRLGVDHCKMIWGGGRFKDKFIFSSGWLLQRFPNSRSSRSWSVEDRQSLK